MGLSTLKSDKTTSKNPFLLQGFLRRVYYCLPLTKAIFPPPENATKSKENPPFLHRRACSTSVSPPAY